MPETAGFARLPGQFTVQVIRKHGEHEKESAQRIETATGMQKTRGTPQPKQQGQCGQDIGVQGCVP
jgi:hypothetical protein